MPEIEGMLLKWTNYVTGWQPRWFILDKGILAYYKSQDEVGQGCKGSVKLACCEIQVHATDTNRMDLFIPGEQYFYVKSSSEAERQQWLVALGSAKACLTDSILHQEKEQSEEELRKKMSELRLYCDLLMQQVTKVQEASNDIPDTEKLKESSSLISQTCDTFLNTLKECMNIANSSFLPHIGQGIAPNDTALHSSSDRKRIANRNRSIEDRYTPPATNKYGIQTRYHNLEDMASRIRNSKDRVRSSSTSSNENVSMDHSHRKVTKDVKGSEIESRTSIKEKDEIKEDKKILRIPTFFSQMSTKFSDIKIKDKCIPTSTFLDACVCIVGIFDALSPTAFAPVKMDINGNIRKIRQKYKSDPDRFGTLQDMIHQEMETNTTAVKNSATDAVMWLRRSLQFIKELLKEIVNGETDMNTVASNAYSRSLKNYHGWVVRGMFVLAARAAPSLEDFQGFIATNKEDIENKNFRPTVMKDLEQCQIAMEVITDLLHEFYIHNNLENTEKV